MKQLVARQELGSQYQNFSAAGLALSPDFEFDAVMKLFENLAALFHTRNWGGRLGLKCLLLSYFRVGDHTLRTAAGASSRLADAKCSKYPGGK